MRTPRCPRCGFAFAWDGRKCGHCPPPSRARQLWESISRFEEQVNSTKEITPRQLLAIAGGCLRRVEGHLSEELIDVTDALERGPAAIRRMAPLAAESEFSATSPELPFVRAINPMLVAAARNTIPELFRAVASLAGVCRLTVGNETYPQQELLSFPLPPELERFRASLERDLNGHRERLDNRPADDPVRQAHEHLMQEHDNYHRKRWQLIAAEERAQCEMVRDMQIYPEITVAFDPAWRTSTAVAMAQGFVESRDFSAMPILADALQDAGCEDPEILEHCRAEKPHYRGCWVIEMILADGK